MAYEGGSDLLRIARLSIINSTAPAEAPFHITPSAAPTGTAEAGNFYVDSTSGSLWLYDGTRFVAAPRYELITDLQNQVAAASYAVSHTIFVNPSLVHTYRVTAISAVFGTASTSGTLNVEVATGTQAIASGVNQMSSTVSLSGTANTVVNGTITTQTTIPVGGRLNLIFAGTVTNLANAAVTVAIERLT